MNKPTISIVIPTRNRLDSLNRTLASIAKQTLLPTEIIIVDSSTNPLTKNQLAVSNENSIVLNSLPSVCLQRNIGIKKSTSDYIFLCDDDIVVSENYIEELIAYLEANPSENIASGLLFERRKNQWNYCDVTISTLRLLITYIFGLSLEVDIHKTSFSNNFIIQKIVNHYKKKGNHISKAGWPCTFDYSNKVIKTPIYGLGVSIIRAEKLKNVLFDTAFYTHGVGDNYDLAIGLNSMVNVIQKPTAYHYKETANRIDSDKAYYYRIGALHYIMMKHERFTYKNLFFLIWSLNGNSIFFLAKGKLKRLLYHILLFFRIIFNRSLYDSSKNKIMPDF